VAEFFLELFSEEIPARMQARAADELSRVVGEALSALAPAGAKTWYGPRRIALALTIAAESAARETNERGPRANAPEQALAGFLRKHGADRSALRQDGDYWVLQTSTASRPAGAIVAEAMPALLRRFAWPKSMRWGGTSSFTWVRPLRRILCLLDGAVVPFTLAEAGDDGHDLASGGVTEGHRFLAPGPVAVSSAGSWEETLATRFVIADQTARRAKIHADIAAAAAAQSLTVVPDDGLLDEVTGLVEFPVALIGRIDAGFMDLPPEVMQVSMRVNQRYFALRDAAGQPAPAFAFAANIAAPDGGAAIIAGNERVLRARFADARHFWDLDRRTALADRVAALETVTFHAKLGSQGARVLRLVALAGHLARSLGTDIAQASRAALLAKADLTSGMVGEFPELQGVMGGYYARHDGEDPEVAEAVRAHYLPRGANDAVPTEAVAIAVALADRLDQLAGFFSIGEKPTGSGDPYALRRAALGIIRIVLENQLRLKLRAPLSAASAAFSPPADAEELLGFILERLRIQLRADGARHDVLAAILAGGTDDDLVRLIARTSAVAAALGTQDGADLLAGYRRAANILRIEDKKDGPHTGAPNSALFNQDEERALLAALLTARPGIAANLENEDFAAAAREMAALRVPLDRFFDRVTVNAEDAAVRLNRLRLLRAVRETMDLLADFSRIEG
jgi:glycyl-tRNA synthetase beta chain